MKSLEYASFPEIAERTDAVYNKEDDSLLLGVLGQDYLIRHDGVYLHGQKAPEVYSAVINDYLTSSGTTATILPWRAIGALSVSPSPEFRKKVEQPLAAYAAEITTRANALLTMLDAKASPSLIGGDMAITVRALPKVHLHVELFLESQDFPAEAWVLFSNNANEFLSSPRLHLLAEVFKDRLLSLLRIYEETR